MQKSVQSDKSIKSVVQTN